MTISQMRELERQATVIEEAKSHPDRPIFFPEVSRFEVIDHSSKKRGRIVVEYGVEVEVSLQDGGKTMKVFLTDKKK
jgi:hypothetical protein